MVTASLEKETMINSSPVDHLQSIPYQQRATAMYTLHTQSGGSEYTQAEEAFYSSQCGGNEL